LQRYAPFRKLVNLANNFSRHVFLYF